ncbi:(2Fe-2S)-binding protein [Marinobacter sp.]|uniref:(2Fe-2S)-binding protein n=1 Tax=Marinobacter sp. TaxID=50741 RepID=UPI002B26BE0D|nr:2Fe-2S iron-sulfur cluster-binding protein [Marinobacter sp.]
MTRPTQPEICTPERVTFKLNGDVISQRVAPATTLLDILRDSGRITSARAGCRIGRCGACTVLLNGEAVPGCLVMAWQLSDCTVQTVEGLTEDPDFVQVRDALATESALQCGYCTPGIAVSLVSGLRQQQSGDAVDLQEAVAGNLCRCTGYGGLKRAIAVLTEASSET